MKYMRSNTDFMLFVGMSGTQGYYITALSSQLGLTTSSTVMNVDTTYALSTSAATTIARTNVAITTLSVLTEDSAGTVTFTITPYDVIYYTIPIAYTGLIPNTFYSKSISLTCTVGGLSIITESITENGANVIPTWVTLDAANLKLNFTPPTVTVATTFTFLIQSTVNGTASTVAVGLSVNPITGGSSGGSSSGSGDSSSGSGSTSAKDSYSSSIDNKSAAYSAATAIGVVSAASVVSSVVSGSSIQGLWSMINQFQFYLLFPMIGAYVPEAILKFLEGIDF
mmetsp:Transcript_42222/g.49078  ORF Transcript_42222/g.49078 Transcript_42222/m.49078 type:complete len:282 (-) Transcript_42222:1165-2010(-)|eukprot:CAMPEP_0168329700 /NCGR_PEP_ID=MMETSP0213-20121227/7268_1 /TAXON_ID=151035 /ORGANISM="Euplotes harpa, Strain FSP1.4" /LENGTH=281 /DNA_ID=CAMNT_0008333083 /DNA_START=1402 /DNA_END=2247 /DNA_ORIENTATION=+